MQDKRTSERRINGHSSQSNGLNEPSNGKVIRRKGELSDKAIIVESSVSLDAGTMDRKELNFLRRKKERQLSDRRKLQREKKKLGLN